MQPKLNISIAVTDSAMARRVVEVLIELERDLRRANGVSGHIPVTTEVRLADAVRDARRNLQDDARRCFEEESD